MPENEEEAVALVDTDLERADSSRRIAKIDSSAA